MIDEDIIYEADDDVAVASIMENADLFEGLEELEIDN